MDEWIEVLRQQCTDTSQTKVAKVLRQPDGFPSPTVVNQVLLDKYTSDKGRARLQALVEGHYMGVTVDCPEMGEMGLDDCAHWQSLPFSTANPLRVEMYRACQNCPHRRDDE